jgi:hypothetical protein
VKNFQPPVAKDDGDSLDRLHPDAPTRITGPATMTKTLLIHLQRAKAVILSRPSREWSHPPRGSVPAIFDVTASTDYGDHCGRNYVRQETAGTMQLL